MTQEQIIWLAAWLEGEGWFGLTKGSIAIQGTSTDHDVITKVAGLLDCKVYPKKTTHKPAFTARVMGQKAEDVMRLIRPHMCERRGAKIDELLIHRAGSFERRASAGRRRWADPGFRSRNIEAIKSSRPKGDPRWSDAAKRGWITRRG